VLPSGFIDLQTLGGLLTEAGSRLPVEVAAYVALEVCEALLRHGGTSAPDQILVGRAGEVRLGSVWSAPQKESARCVLEVFAGLAGPEGRALLEEGPEGEASTWTVDALRTHLAAALFPLSREECREALLPILERLQRAPGEPLSTAGRESPIQVGWRDGEHEVAADVDDDAVFAALEEATRQASRARRRETASTAAVAEDPGSATGPRDGDVDMASGASASRQQAEEKAPTRPADISPTMAPPRLGGGELGALARLGRPAPPLAQVGARPGVVPPMGPAARLPPQAPTNPRGRVVPRRSEPPEGEGEGQASSWLPPSLEDLPNLGTFEGLELLGLVAVGGMAQVFLARDRPAEAFERLVAVKRMLPHLTTEPGHLQMFADEARIGFRLRHPNICHVYEYGHAHEVPYLVMEWVHGVTLSRLVSRAQTGLSPGVAAHLVAQVASALDYAHRSRDRRGEPLRIVHRDVSPQNVMVSFDGFVKLLDFGVAKANAQVQRTEGGMVKGKFGYMSPEQCLGLPLDGRSDVFSLGICLYETLTGSHLYHRENLVASVQSILNDPVPDPRDERPELPEALASVVVRALQKKPEDRFQSAAEFERSLASFLQQLSDPVTDGDLGALVRQRCGDDDREGALGLMPLPPDLRSLVGEPPPTQELTDPEVGPGSKVADAAPTGARGGSASGPGWGGQAARLAGSFAEAGRRALRGLGPLVARGREQLAGQPALRGAAVLGALLVTFALGRCLGGAGSGAPSTEVRAVAEPGAGQITAEAASEGAGTTPEEAVAAPQEATVAAPQEEAVGAPQEATAGATPEQAAGAPPEATVGGAPEEAAAPDPGGEAAAPEVDPNTPGHLWIDTAPSGGAIRVDGAFYRGRTPMEVRDLAPGDHEVLASKPGRKPQRVTVTVSPGKTTEVTIELPPRPR